MLTQFKDFAIDTKWHINSLFGMSDQHTLSEWSRQLLILNFIFERHRPTSCSLQEVNEKFIKPDIWQYPFFVWNNIVIIAWCSVGSVCVVQRLAHCCLGILSPKSGITCIFLKFLCISLYYLPLKQLILLIYL